jgi:hypothetical protein
MAWHWFGVAAPHQNGDAPGGGDFGIARSFGLGDGDGVRLAGNLDAEGDR